MLRHLRPALMAGLAILLLTRSSGAADGRPLSGPDLYARLAAQAGAGDPQALEYKARLDEYLEASALRAASLDLPTQEVSLQSRGAVALRVEDSAPWGISIANVTAIESPEAIVTYRDARHAALAALAVADADRPILVVAAPARPLSLAELADALPCPCKLEQLIVDIFSADGGWLMSSSRNMVGADLASAPDIAEREILDQAAFSLDQFSGVERSGIRAQVRSVRVSLAASNALELSLHPDMLVVDPLTDIADEYADAAAVVAVESSPDMWEAYARLVRKEPIDENLIQPDGREGS